MNQKAIILELCFMEHQNKINKPNKHVMSWMRLVNQFFNLYMLIYEYVITKNDVFWH